jgi:hypothetical protein
VTRRLQAFECVYEVEVQVAVLVTEIGMQGEDDRVLARDALARSRARSPRAWACTGTIWACAFWPVPCRGDRVQCTGSVLVLQGYSRTRRRGEIVARDGDAKGGRKCNDMLSFRVFFSLSLTLIDQGGTGRMQGS